MLMLYAKILLNLKLLKFPNPLTPCQVVFYTRGPYFRDIQKTDLQGEPVRVENVFTGICADNTAWPVW